MNKQTPSGKLKIIVDPNLQDDPPTEEEWARAMKRRDLELSGLLPEQIERKKWLMEKYPHLYKKFEEST